MITRRIDHLVLAVHDLDAAARVYEALGFQVGARNRHPWGTENRIIQFRSSFLELITLGEDAAQIAPHAPGIFSFGAFVRDYLAQREGFAMFVLDSDDARADAAAFASAGIGAYEPFFFERKGRRADGTEVHVAFTLAFATDARLPDAAFFTCQQHFPEAFWTSALQEHPNGASNVSAVTLGVQDPAAHAGFLAAFTGAKGANDTCFKLGEGGELLVEPSGAGAFIGFRIATPDLDSVRDRLKAAGLPYAEDGGRVTLDESVCFGASISFGA